MIKKKEYELGRITHRLIMASGELLLKFNRDDIDIEAISREEYAITRECHDMVMKAYKLLDPLAYPE